MVDTSSTAPLWTWDELVKASGGIPDLVSGGPPTQPIKGFSIDTRSLAPGDVFVALEDQRDGHEFVTAAFARGAAAALVDAKYARKPGDGALIRRQRPLDMLRRIGMCARSRLAPIARVIAITGSAGKTGTTAMLRAALFTGSGGGKTHAPEKSFNNHWGVPLTLARMPEDTAFAVFEIGMNHADEIRPLVQLVRPHIAIVTNVLPVHVGNFPNGEIGVANAKAEIFDGFLTAGGVAIIPRDNPHFELLSAKARASGAKIKCFGRTNTADVFAKSLRVEPDQSIVELPCGLTYRLRTPGEHIALNSLAVMAALRALTEDLGAKVDMDFALQALQFITATPGRGAQARYLVRAPGSAPLDDILLIDESYNANPASMRAALAVLGAATPASGRRIAVMGDMRELGDLGHKLHQELLPAITGNGIDLVFACGPLMHGLFEQLPESNRGAWSEASTGLIAPLFEALQPGDVVMIKGSLGTNMAPIVNEFKARDERLRQEFEGITKSV